MEKENTEALRRRLSLPDLGKLREEWDKREAVQTATDLPKGKLQVKIVRLC